MQGEQLRGVLAQSLVVGVAGLEPEAADLEAAGQQGLGGVILFARNVAEPQQVWRLNRDLRSAARQAGKPPLFVMVDQEGGRVARLKGDFTHAESMAELGAAGDPDRVRAHAARVGRELTAAGFNWNLAPVADVHAIEDGIMASRSFGGDPKLVGEMAAAYLEGLAAAGCLGCLKHFPGLGRTTLDTHKERPTVGLSAPELAAMELPPFVRGIAAGAPGVMVCHAVFAAYDPDRPASLSPVVIEGVLRKELGFKGAVLSDDLEMGAIVGHSSIPEAARAAYAAGCDILLICHRQQEALAALDLLCREVESGAIPMSRVEAGARRIARLKENLPRLPPPLAELTGLLAAKA